MSVAIDAAGTEKISSAPVVVRPTRWGQVALGAGAILVLALFAILIGKNQATQWSAIPAFLVDRSILSGIVVTLELTAAAMAVGIALGAILAAMAIGENYVLRTLSAAFVWGFRGVPLIVQIFFWFNIALFVPDLKIAGYDVSVNAIVTPQVAGLLALGLHEAANMAEVIRSGLLSVDLGQYDACRALGLTRGEALRNIILPQALRVIIPPTGNQAIGMLKASAIVSVIGMEDLLTQAQHIYARNFLVTELLAVASIWYLAMTTVASVGQHYLERHFARGFGRGSVKRAQPNAAGPGAAPE